MALPSFSRISGRSNPKDRTHRRRRNPAPDGDATVDDHELTSYLAALAREPDEDPESTGSGRRFGDGLVCQIRVNHVAGQQLKDLAEQRNTSPQELARAWVLERLSWESQLAFSGVEQDAEAPDFNEQSDGPETDELFLGHGLR